MKPITKIEILNGAYVKKILCMLGCLFFLLAFRGAIKSSNDTPTSLKLFDGLFFCLLAVLFGIIFIILIRRGSFCLSEIRQEMDKEEVNNMLSSGQFENASILSNTHFYKHIKINHDWMLIKGKLIYLPSVVLFWDYVDSLHDSTLTYLYFLYGSGEIVEIILHPGTFSKEDFEGLRQFLENYRIIIYKSTISKAGIKNLHDKLNNEYVSKNIKFTDIPFHKNDFLKIIQMEHYD